MSQACFLPVFDPYFRVQAPRAIVVTVMMMMMIIVQPPLATALASIYEMNWQSINDDHDHCCSHFRVIWLNNFWSELSAGGAKRDVENTPLCILASRSHPALPAVGRLRPSDDDVDLINRRVLMIIWEGCGSQIFSLHLQFFIKYKQWLGWWWHWRGPCGYWW